LPFPEIEKLSYNIVTLQTKPIHVRILLVGQREEESIFSLRFIDLRGKGENTGQGLNNEQYGVM